jgi:hypothetical protein
MSSSPLRNGLSGCPVPTSKRNSCRLDRRPAIPTLPSKKQSCFSIHCTCIAFDFPRLPFTCVQSSLTGYFLQQQQIMTSDELLMRLLAGLVVPDAPLTRKAKECAKKHCLYLQIHRSLSILQFLELPIKSPRHSSKIVKLMLALEYQSYTRDRKSQACSHGI